MGRNRRILGPLFYSSLFLALITLLSLGAWLAWPTVSRTGTIWWLSRQLASSDPGVRGRAAKILVAIGSDAAPWVRGALRDRSAETRLLACETLRQIWPRPTSHFSDMIDALGDEDARVRGAAAEALGELWEEPDSVTGGGTRDRAIRALCAASRDTSWEVRDSAVRALGSSSPESELAANELEHATHDIDRRVRAAAALMLARYAPSNLRVLDALRETIADQTWGHDDLQSRIDAKFAAARKLEELAGDDALQRMIIPLLTHADAQLRLDALFCLRRPLPLTEPLRAALRQAAREGAPRVRGQAAAAVALVDRDLGRKVDPENLAALISSVEQPVEGADDGVLFLQHFRTLAIIAPGSEASGVSVLVGMLEQLSPAERPVIVDLLIEMGPAARAAIPRLLVVSRSRDEGLAAAAQSVLEKIDPAPGAR
jgi:HEAT repeat protein